MRKKVNKYKKKSKLSKHNDLGFLADLNHICMLGYISESKRSWIETTMLQLRNKANKYEDLFGDYLINKKIEFIHQAPFIFSGKIYFADFYLPNHHLIVEIDGIYHTSYTQNNYDRFRDECFNGHKIKVLRIPNMATTNKKDLDLLVSPYF